MNTLGISGIDHGFAVSLVAGSNVSFAIEEDKLRRFRGLGFKDVVDTGARALDLAVDRAGGPSSVDEIAFAPPIDSDPAIVEQHCRSVRDCFFRFYGQDVPVRPVDHVQAHTAFDRAVYPEANYFFMVGSSRAVFADSAGRSLSESAFHVGEFTVRCARFLGLGRAQIHHLENLARFGNESLVEPLLEMMTDEEEGRGDTTSERARLARLEVLTGIARRHRGVGLERGHFDLAASLFSLLRSGVAKAFESAGAPEGATIVLSGGVFQSWRLNDAIASLFPRHRFVVSFAPGNAGGAIGAALVGRDLPGSKPLLPFLGPRYDRNAVKGILDNSKARYSLETQADMAELVCDALSQGKMVGWFYGACEFGFRALGGRSVFANPADPYARDNLSSFLKRRPSYFTYAVAVKEDHPDARGLHSPFLTRSTVMPDYFGDNPVRVQTVSKSMNPGLFHLLGALESREGVSALLNTSLNYFDEPIACTPRDALKTFHASGLDMLAIEGFALRKY